MPNRTGKPLSFTALLCLFGVLGAATPAAAETTKKTGKHFQVVCHFGKAGATARKALDAAEATWAVVLELLQGKKGPKHEPLKIHIYRTAKDYEAAEKKLTGGVFKANQAFTHTKTRASHIALQPPLSDAILRSIPLPEQTRRLVAHEAVHLVVATLLPNQSAHLPFWLDEGLAEWVAQRVICVDRKAATSPYFSTAQVIAGELLKGDTLPSVADILADRWGKLYSGGRYAASLTLFAYLHTTESKGFKRFLKNVRRLGGGSGFADRSAEMLRKHVGKTDAQLNTGYRAYLKKLAPEWDEVFRSLETQGSAWEQLTLSKNAIAWRTSQAGKRYRLEGAFELLPTSNTQMNILLDRSRDGFVSVALRPDSVTVFDYRSKGNRWNNRGAFDIKPAAAVGKRVPFRVEVRGKTLRVWIAGKKLVELEPNGGPLDGPWGLGVQRGGGGVWHKIRHTPLK